MLRRLALLCAAVALCGCGLIRFDVHSTGTNTIPGSPLGGVLPQLAFTGFSNFDLTRQSGFDNTDTRKDHITSARLTQLTIKVTSPQGQDLSFFSTIKFTISAAGLQTQEIAHLESFPKGATSVDLTLDDVELQDYAKADSFSISTTTTGQAPTQSTTIEADLTINIHANPL